MNPVMIDQILGGIGWKDTQLRHLGCNVNLARALKLKRPEDIVGLKDSDFPIHTEQDYLFHFQNDQLALLGKTVKIVHLYQESAYFVTKKPLIDATKKIIGVIYHCQELEHPDFFFQLNQTDKKSFPATGAISHYKVQSEHNPFHFSKREKECIFYLLRGKTTKQTSEILNLSKRTVDYYIENIKNKTGCRSKSELLVTAIKSGYMDIIP
jgi:DNA-binding CsgD family transcriptional regulator